MRWFLICILCLASCASHERDEHFRASSVSRYIKSDFAGSLTKLLARIERGDLQAWREFASYASRVDGEQGEAYDVACAELTRRDPTFYLRRYLAGDTDAIRCGRSGYGWAGPHGRSLLDAVYAERLYIAFNAEERQRITAFIAATTAPHF